MKADYAQSQRNFTTLTTRLFGVKHKLCKLDGAASLPAAN